MFYSAGYTLHLIIDLSLITFTLQRVKRSYNDIIRVDLVNYQLDGQFFYFIIRLLQTSTCFEQRRAHHQEIKFY